MFNQEAIINYSINEFFHQKDEQQTKILNNAIEKKNIKKLIKLIEENHTLINLPDVLNLILSRGNKSQIDTIYNIIVSNNFQIDFQIDFPGKYYHFKYEMEQYINTLFLPFIYKNLSQNDIENLCDYHNHHNHHYDNLIIDNDLFLSRLEFCLENNLIKDVYHTIVDKYIKKCINYNNITIIKDIFKILLKFGYDPNKMINYCYYSHLLKDEIDNLISLGAKPSNKLILDYYHYGRDINIDFFNYLIDDLKLDINHINDDGSTIFFNIVSIDCNNRFNLDIINHLIKKGANPYYIDDNGNNIYHHIFRRFSIYNIFEIDVDINAKNKDGLTPIQYYRGSFEWRFETLLNLGIDLHVVDQYGNTLLHNHINDAVDSSLNLINHGVDITKTNNEGFTPIHYLKEYRYKEIKKRGLIKEFKIKNYKPLLDNYESLYDFNQSTYPKEVKEAVIELISQFFKDKHPIHPTRNNYPDMNKINSVNLSSCQLIDYIKIDYMTFLMKFEFYIISNINGIQYNQCLTITDYLFTRGYTPEMNANAVYDKLNTPFHDPNDYEYINQLMKMSM